MLRALVCLMIVLQRLSSPLALPEDRVVFAMKSGILLRMHVVAQDDTEEMQRVKFAVRDAVRQAYDEQCPEPALSMLKAAADMLPELTRVASETALREGFAGDVSVDIETLSFDERELDGYILPEGDYPALMIRLGDAQGHNWWGLIDPELSLRAASLPGEYEGGLTWDWSLRGLIAALLGLPLTAQEAGDA